MRTRIMNQLQAAAMNEGKRWKMELFSAQRPVQLEALPLAPWARLPPYTLTICRETATKWESFSMSWRGSWLVCAGIINQAGNRGESEGMQCLDNPLVHPPPANVNPRPSITSMLLG